MRSDKGEIEPKPKEPEKLRFERCERCFGSGEIKVSINCWPSPEESILECPDCKGKGKVPLVR